MATLETTEKKVAKAMMVLVIISNDGAVHRDSVKSWKHFASDIKDDWVRMAWSVLRYNVAIVGKFFNKGGWTSEAWRKDHPEVFEEVDEPPERMATADERRKSLNPEPRRDQ